MSLNWLSQFRGQLQLFTFIRLFLASHAAVIAENLFLRRRLALFQERKVKSRRSTAATRTFMVLLRRFFDWREALVIVKPETSDGNEKMKSTV